MSGSPILRLQTASLYASGDASTFTGSGGPYGFDPFTAQFGGVVSSAGLTSDPFSDTVYSVEQGDEVTFVIAVQDVTSGAGAYGVTLHEVMPAGFIVPTDGSGIDLSVTDGTGTDLATSGDLFGAGLVIGGPIAGYDANSGLNVALVTFTLQAGTSLPGPYATIMPTATLAGYAATAGGPDLSGANPASASTTVVTAAPIPTVTPETDPSAVARGQTVAFDVSVVLAPGSLQNLQLIPVPVASPSTLDIVSSTVLSFGAGLTHGTPTIGADGSIQFGTVTAATGAAVADNTLTARFVVRADGTASGTATLQTILSASSAGAPGGVFTTTVDSSVGVIVPPSPPTLSGLSSGDEFTRVGIAYNPFANLVISDTSPNESATLAVALQDATLGRLSAMGAGTVDSSGGSFMVSGTLGFVQQAARLLAFTPGASTGIERFNLTVAAATGAVAQDASTALVIGPQDPLFDAQYYLTNNPDVAAAGADPYQHYAMYGWREGRNPDAYFDTRYYLTMNPDVAAAGIDPLMAFEQNGWQRGRDPSLLFSVRGYENNYPDVAMAQVDPLVHYVQHGQAEGRVASLVGFDGAIGAADPLVNPAYLDRQLGARLIPAGVVGQAQAAELYDALGRQRGLNPDAYFDTNYYLTQNPDVKAAGFDPLTHFETHGFSEGREPSLVFSDAKYLATYADVKNAGVDPLLHYVTDGQAEGRMAFLPETPAAADPLVDPAFYDAQLGATILPGGTDASTQAAASFDRIGWQRGLNPDAYFDTNYYLTQNPDVKAAGFDPLTHYEAHGWQEGRNPSAQFSDAKYLAAYADARAAGIDPLRHFLTVGQAEGHVAFRV